MGGHTRWKPDPFGNQAMPAPLAAAMKWEPICGTHQGIEFLADLLIQGCGLHIHI